MYDFLEKFIGSGAYQAPPGTSVVPWLVEEKMEYLELITGGKVYFRGEDGIDRTYGRGSLFWHIAGDRTVCRYPENAPYQCITFEFQVSRSLREVPRVAIPKKKESLLEFAQMIFREYHAGNNSQEFMQMAYSTFRWYVSGSPQIPGDEPPHVLDTALRFMQQNLRNTILLSEVASVAEVSLPYLYPLFKKYTGMSPHQYLLKQRLTRAKQLLAGGRLEIKWIAQECGFGSVEVFYRHFVKNTGMTPAEYRRRFDPLLPGSFSEGIKQDGGGHQQG